MKVILLCGGLGMRPREETEFRPKPMIEIGGRPILSHIMKSYAHYGFTDFVLSLGYKAEFIRRYFLEYESMHNDFTIELSSVIITAQRFTREPLGARLAGDASRHRP